MNKIWEPEPITRCCRMYLKVTAAGSCDIFIHLLLFYDHCFAVWYFVSIYDIVDNMQHALLFLRIWLNNVVLMIQYSF